MAKKLKNILIRLVSTAGTGYFYATTKNPTNIQHKLALMKVRAAERRVGGRRRRER